MKRTIFFGSDDFGLPALERLLADGLISLVAVVTQPARPTGRHHEFTPTPVARWAEAQNIPVMAWDSLRGKASELRALQPELMLVASYGLLIPADVLDLTPGQCLNIHASLLPSYRGASPIAQAILDGQAETGVTIMSVVPALDAGPILDTYRMAIDPTDAEGTLRAKLSQLAAYHLSQTLQEYWRDARTLHEQDHDRASYAKKISRADGQARWESCRTEERKVRAYDPWPGVWTMVNGERLKILQAVVRLGQPTALPGTIEQLDPIHWGIACPDGWLIPERVQREGKKPSDAARLPAELPHLIGTRCA